LHNRLRELRKKLGLSQTEFGERLNKNYNTVQRWELGKNSIPASIINLICLEFNVNHGWLETGEGNMFKRENIAAEHETIRYVTAQNIYMTPLFRNIPKNFPAYDETDIDDWIRLPDIDGSAVLIAPESACGITAGAYISVYTFLSDIPDKSIIVARHGEDVIIRMLFGDVLTDMRPGIPDIKKDDCKIIAVVSGIVQFSRI